MEHAGPLTAIRAQLCVVIDGFDQSIDRERVWPDAAEEFLRKILKLGIQVTIIGPRPARKFGSKKTIRFLDRHEVVGMKVLEASRAQRLEFRVLNSGTKAWTRLRAEACVTMGPGGVWPRTFSGWTLPGSMSIDALARWIGEQKWMPGREFAFLGSSNRVMRWASLVLERGAGQCYVIEEEPELRCWRAYRDRFLAKGGRVLVGHRVQRAAEGQAGKRQLFLSNEQGTLVVDADTVVLSPVNERALNAPEEWKRGLFYVQRRTSPWEAVRDEDYWLERLDWTEIYWRVGRYFEAVDHTATDGALRALRGERQRFQGYRKTSREKDLAYSGKILARDTLAAVQASVSVPKSFAKAKPLASLECLQEIPCRACADACPESAIEITKLIDEPRLIEDRCTGCGACVAVCPAGAAVMVREDPRRQVARYFLPDDSTELWKPGQPVNLLNRRGEQLGMGRVVASSAHAAGAHRLLEVEASHVHLWEARAFRLPEAELRAREEGNTADLQPSERRDWIFLDGVRRLAPVDAPLLTALWKIGRRRFEDALFCHDGSCRLCEVRVDGRPALACSTVLREGMKVEVPRPAGRGPAAGSPHPLCPCRGVSGATFTGLLAEGATESIACELTGLGRGVCHGRWCLGLAEVQADLRDGAESRGSNLRPVFHGYRASPWRDIVSSDVISDDSEE